MFLVPHFLWTSFNEDNQPVSFALFHRGAVCTGTCRWVPWHYSGNGQWLKPLLCAANPGWQRWVNLTFFPCHKYYYPHNVFEHGAPQKGITIPFVLPLKPQTVMLSLTGRSAFIGIGFGDRGDAFDFNVALQDHFKYELLHTESCLGLCSHYKQ